MDTLRIYDNRICPEFLRSHRVIPGQRIVVAGNGPLNVQVAAELLEAGATVVAVVEVSRCNSPTRVSSVIGACLADLPLFISGIRYLTRLRRAGIPILFGHALVEAIGEDRVSCVKVAPIDELGKAISGRTQVLETDIACVGYGFEPNDEIPKLLGASAEIDAETNRRRFILDKNCQSSVSGLYIVGDALGLGGSRVALTQGSLVGAAVRESLVGKRPEPRWASHIRKRLAKSISFQRHLWQLFKAPDLLLSFCRGDTVVCRCEEVRLSDLKRHAEQLSSAGNIKRATRAGMGRCQGRYCGPVIERLVVEAGAYRKTPIVGFAPRPPIKPVLISEIASEPDA